VGKGSGDNVKTPGEKKKGSNLPKVLGRLVNGRTYEENWNGGKKKS